MNKRDRLDSGVRVPGPPQPLVPGQAQKWLREALSLSESDTPFPWQETLLNSFLQGVVPSALDIPTGLGKTAVMAIWMIARACGAASPRRLVYVVDRRAVVDQATEVAITLRELVDRDSGIKTALGLNKGHSLPISTLRGRFVDNREWLEEPASPAIIVGTVDMIGSRLLFEGYGVTRKMRPYHAGLLGADTLLVLDEAHLVPPFERLLQSITERFTEFGPRDEALRSVIPQLTVLSLSATGRSVGTASLGLTAEDLHHPVVKKRLHATKRLFLKPLMPISNEDSTADATGPDNERQSKLDDALASEAWKLSAYGASTARVIVYCDSRKIAVNTKKAVERLARGDKGAGTEAVAIDTELFIGGRRIFEREQAKARLEELGFISGNSPTRDRPAFLFATSAAEVGVDLDAEHMVCDLVAWERMVQRLGRVNRRGDGTSTVVVVLEPKPNAKKTEQAAIGKKDRGEELEAKERKLVESFDGRCRRWQSCQAPFEHLPMSDGSFDASLCALRDLRLQVDKDQGLRKLIDDATTRAPLRPAVTRSLVDAWSMTSLVQHTGRPAIDPWLRGWVEDDPPQTAVVWRTHLPVRSGSKQPTKREVEAFFEAASLHTSELLETESFNVISWIEARAKAILKRTRAESSGNVPSRDDIVAFVLSRAGELERTFRLNELLSAGDSADKNVRTDDPLSSLRGATVVVDVRLAGLKDGLLDETEDAQPRTSDDEQVWLGEHVAGFRIRCAATDENVVKDSSWRERLRFAADVSAEGEPQRWLIIEKWRHEGANEDDRSSSRPQLLHQHRSWAETRVRSLAQRLELDDQYAEMLAVAAHLHDEGKRARRWQRAFNAPADGLYAKTKGPISFARLDGYRHELGSLLYTESDERFKRLPTDLRELVLHLIAAHHGYARPLIGTHGCEDAPPSVVEEQARNVAIRFARLQRRWGPWGLAWWEALLRSADQQASRDNDISDPAQPTEAL